MPGLGPEGDSEGPGLGSPGAGVLLLLSDPGFAEDDVFEPAGFARGVLGLFGPGLAGWGWVSLLPGFGGPDFGSLAPGWVAWFG